MGYIILKATEFDKQAAAWRKGKRLADLTHTHIAQRKYDGCNLIVNTETQQALSRTGERVRSVQHIIDQAVSLFGRDAVLLGEAWIPGTPFPAISGKFRQHDPATDLVFVVFDLLPAPAFSRGTEYRYADRLSALQHMLFRAQHAYPNLMLAESYTPGTYGNDPVALAQQWVARGGYDGLILRDPLAGWRPEPSKYGELIKVKPTQSLDLRVVATHTAKGDKTGREVLTLAVEYRGVVTHVGSGVPHSLTGDEAQGKIIEVEFMGLTEDGKLREPRFKGIRDDKLEADE